LKVLFKSMEFCIAERKEKCYKTGFPRNIILIRKMEKL